MRITTLMALGGLVLALTACETRLRGGQTVAEYCANSNNSDKAVCQLNVEINGTQTALADTDLKLSEARAIAESATNAAANAQETADTAMSMASAALNSVEDLYCETHTINQTNIGSCPANLKVMSCTQTRYTFRAGGPSILREIDDEKCRFHDRVLEMRVRCCTVASSAPSTASFTSDPTG
ncbi:MAG: hypothetical protein AAF292_01495 [Pseudomonadota bacterium]